MKKEEKIEIIPITQAFAVWKDSQSTIQYPQDLPPDYFTSYITTLPFLAAGPYYWQIYSAKNNTPSIIDVGGAVNELTPYSREQLTGSDDQSLIFSLFHPADLPHVLTFIAKVIEFLFVLPKEEKNSFHITIYGRVKNANGDYVWNAIQYPSFYWDEEGKLLYGLVVYYDVSHLKNDHELPLLSILDRTGNNNQVFSCYYADENKPVYFTSPAISKREQEVLLLIQKGKTSKEIAGELHIAKNTVENHRQRLLKKFGAASSIELLSKINRF